MDGHTFEHYWINRYIMECKLWYFYDYILILPVELIDTLWNVNNNKIQCAACGYLGINRYIMECKWIIFL